jgi:CBS domain-containing protein
MQHKGVSIVLVRNLLSGELVAIVTERDIIWRAVATSLDVQGQYSKGYEYYSHYCG